MVRELPAVKEMQSLPAGTTAILVATGVVIHPQMATLLPQHTYLVPLTTVGVTSTYSVEIRGYTLDQFIAIVLAYANGDFERAEKLLAELATPAPTAWYPIP